MQNGRIILSSRPSGVAQTENFAIDVAAVQTPREGEILVRNHFLSVEPAMCGWIADAGAARDALRTCSTSWTASMPAPTLLPASTGV